jgi:acyl carrier protein
MKPSREELRRRIVVLVADALDRDAAEVSPHDSLIDDLGAESIDFLDLQFRIETAFGLKLTDEELWRGSFDPRDPRWVDQGRLTPAAIEAVRQRQPDYRWERFAKGIAVADLPRLLTIDTIVDHLERRLAAAGETDPA